MRRLPAIAVLVGSSLAFTMSDAAEPIIIHGETSFLDVSHLVFDYDLPDGGPWDVTLYVELGGRNPSIVQAARTGGDVGGDVESGVARQIVWDAGADRRRLNRSETAWVLATSLRHATELLASPVDGLFFVTIPAGRFLMGSPPREASRKDNEGPQLERAVASVQMSTTEVTQQTFEAIMGFNDSKMKMPQRPVEKVTFHSAVAFCEKLGKLDPSYSYRLPTEVEWEYACRAGTITPYYWSHEAAQAAHFRTTADPLPPEGRVAMVPLGWCTENAMKTWPVGTKEANAWGLYDMHGNVWEWCLDVFLDHHEVMADPAADMWSRAISELAQTEPEKTRRVIKGGSWLGPATECRAASRKGVACTDRKKNLGFRVVRVVGGG